MSKRIVKLQGNESQKSLSAMINMLSRIIGDEVYIRPVLEVESSEGVLKALDAVLEGARTKLNKEQTKEGN